MKTDLDKELLLEQLHKTPIIQVACEKLGIGRTTYYRWRRDDEAFAKKADEAVRDGSLLVNDMAESQLISAIKDKNITAIIFWLKNHHASYANKLEVTGRFRVDEPLTPEQEALIQQALKLAALTMLPSEAASSEPIGNDTANGTVPTVEAAEPKLLPPSPLPVPPPPP